jgi:hypothetical protein
MSFPREETTPRPVTTTLRSDGLVAIKKGQLELAPAKAAPNQIVLQLFLLDVFYVFDDVPDALQFFGLFIRDFVPEFLFQRHDELHRVE